MGRSVLFGFVSDLRQRVLAAAKISSLTVLASLPLLVAMPGDGEAAKKTKSKYAAIVIDHKTGKVLHAKNADAYRYPASLTKIMTLYILFEELEAKRVSYKTRMRVSKYAASRPPSKLGLKVGSTLRVRDAIYALVTKSANDASVVVAEHISGSEAAFARRMTRTARRLGMSKTTFKNANGLPNAKQRTTARDMAILGRVIQVRFPGYYKVFKTRSFTFRGRRYGNHNKLLGRVKGVDGIKTGYTRASGFNLTSSVKSKRREIVAVVMGGHTGRWRNARMRYLISRYLPKATRGKRTQRLLIARAVRKSTGKTAYNRLIKNPPMPTRNPVRVAALKKAGKTQLATVKVKTVPVKAPLTQATAGVLTTASVASMPIPAAKPNLAKAKQQPLPPKIASAPSKAAKASDTPRPGWQIQIAAVDDPAKADSMHAHAKTKARRALRGVSPFTQKVTKGETTFYRVRFAGFENKRKARQACAVLKKSDFACLALRK